MHDRILDFSEQGASLSVRLEQLRIRPAEGPEASLPLADIAVLVLAHPAIHLTQAVLGGLAEHGGVLLTCDSSRLPAGMMLPLVGHHVQGLRAAAQVKATQPTRKRLWQSIVRAKITHQALTLEDLCSTDGGLRPLVGQVRSGDPGNVEARAARRYWPLLFNSSEFRRAREQPDANRFLNYGYAVLRAAVARALCSAGLLPSVGLHHHNRYDPFPLADDMMEPFRPLIDRAVWELADRIGPEAPLEREAKAALIAPVTARYLYQNEKRTFFDILFRICASLAGAMAGECRDIALPDFAHFHCAQESIREEGP